MKKNVIVAIVVLLWIYGTGALVYAGNKLEVFGDFTVNVDFNTLTLKTVGANCLLEVEAELEFTGTLEGVAVGATRALVLAPCEDVQNNPPGTFKDVFRSNLEFLGTLDGEPVIADLAYRGITAVGGSINGLFHLSNGARGVMRVVALVAVGGSYQGSVSID